MQGLAKGGCDKRVLRVQGEAEASEGAPGSEASADVGAGRSNDDAVEGTQRYPPVRRPALALPLPN